MRLRLSRCATGVRTDGADPAGALARAEKQVRELEAADPPPALAALALRLGLTAFERDVLLLCTAMELDTRVGGLCAQTQDDPHRAYPTFALALSLFDNPEWAALAPDRPLRALRLIEVHQPAATPLIAAALRIDERILHYLKGLNRLDDRLDGLVAAADDGDRPEEVPPSQRAVAAAAVRAWRAAADEQAPLPVIQLTGPDPASKRLVAGEAARAVGLILCRLPAEHLPHAPAELEALARLWRRESWLLPLALYLDADEAGGGPAVARFLASCPSPMLLGVRERLPRLGRQAVTLEVAKPQPAEQRSAWQTALGPGSDEAARRLAMQFNLNVPAIRQTARLALASVEGDLAAAAEATWDACREQARPRVEGLAQRIDARATWRDLVLPEAVEQALRRVASQVRHRATVYEDWGFGRVLTRGLGITALFSGPSGTGKTMAAEVLANDLRLDLFRIDLGAVVSKYIGETEKNLGRLFDAFEESGAILFFDEADALFGKRTEVRDSHDRYANIEVNYLLQRMESYRGLAILATNFRAALDAAFLRRLRFVVEFPMPGLAERRRLWAGAFPTGESSVPIAGLDTTRLARMDLSGGNIHGAALNAAFRAAAAGTPVTMREVLAAVRDEYVRGGARDPRVGLPLAAGGRSGVMKIHVHIERLVLDSLPIERRDAALIQQAVETELARLLADEGPSAAVRAGGSVDRLTGGVIELGRQPAPEDLGGQIAGAVYRSMGT